MPEGNAILYMCSLGKKLRLIPCGIFIGFSVNHDVEVTLLFLPCATGMRVAWLQAFALHRSMPEADISSTRCISAGELRQ
jgi:hypothetical protein